MKTPEELLSADELRAMDLTVELIGLLGKIIRTPRNDAMEHEHLSIEDKSKQSDIGNGDIDEMVFHIHAIQRTLMSQAAARAYPKKFRLLGDFIRQYDNL